MNKVKNFLRQQGALLLLAGLIFGLHAVFNGQYGFHRDELDILLNARQLDWGYVAYPPFTPFIARMGLLLFGSSLTGLRLFSALGQGLVVILTGMMTADLGGKRGAQLLAALAAGSAPAALTAGTLLQYMAFDYLWWVVIAFCFVRILKTEDPRGWLGVGAAIGMAALTKYTAIFFIAGLVAATLLTTNRRYLRSPWLWAGAGLSILIVMPNLIWQIRHSFISLDFLSAIHARDIEWGRARNFLPEQLYISANPFALPIWMAGLAFSLFAPGFKRFRALGIAFLVTFGLFWFLRGRAYYVSPAYPMLCAVGAAGWEGWLKESANVMRKTLSVAGWTLVSLGMLVGLVLVKPIAPVNSALWDITSEINREVVEMVGWEDLTAQVAEIFARIPEAEQPRTIILAGNYGEAGALDLYGRAYGLPPVISGANSLWERGYGSFEPETVIVVGFELSYASKFFGTCDFAGRVSNSFGVKNEESTYHNSLYVCRQPRQPWEVMWLGMQWFQ